MKLNKLLLIAFTFFCSSQFLVAQVEGLSYTFSPYGDYNWFDDYSGMENGFIVGGQLGFGFGKHVELLANYGQGLSLQTDLENFGFTPTEAQLNSYVARDVKLKRYGGDVKLNLFSGSFKPFLIIGTGIQSMKADTFSKSEQIYVNAGAGFILSANDRFALTVSALNTRYRHNAPRSFMTSDEIAGYGLDVDDYDRKMISNWSARVALGFYLGGTKPGTTSEIEESYADQYRGGYKGLNMPISLEASKMEFHDDLPYRNTWLVGGSAGFNFGQFVGLRGFYWRGLEDGSSLEFDELSMYGGEATFRLSEGKGLTPWLSLGGGTIHVTDDYVGRVDSMNIPTNHEFAMGGFGIDIPFTRSVSISGFVRAILTTGADADNLESLDQVNTSWNYGGSLNFVIGHSKDEIEAVSKSDYDAMLTREEWERQMAVEAMQADYEERMTREQYEEEMREDSISQAYNDRLVALEAKLDAQLKKSEMLSDSLAAAKAGQQKEEEEEKQMYPPYGYPGQPYQQGYYMGEGEVRMSPAQFQLLLRDIMDNARQPQYYQVPPPQQMPPDTSQMRSSTPPQGAAPQNAGSQSDAATLAAIAKTDSSVEDLRSVLAQLMVAQSQLSSDNSDLARQVSQITLELTSKLDTIEHALQLNLSGMDAIEDRQFDLETRTTAVESTRQPPVIAPGTSFQDSLTQMRMYDMDKRLDNLQLDLSKALAELEAANYRSDTVRHVVVKDTVSVVQPPTVKPVQTQSVTTTDSTEEYGNFFSRLQYDGMSGFAGLSFGKHTTFNLGIRLHFPLAGTQIEFQPETFVGIGSPSAFGLSLNAVYYLYDDAEAGDHLLNPYGGAGVGFLNADEKLTGAFNLVLGTTLPVSFGDGKFYADWTIRNFFKYNQFALGYRLPF